MFERSIPPDADLPYVPLPRIAREVAMTSISNRGFKPLEEYNLFSFKENLPLKTNIIAFAHQVHRTPEYTGLTVFNATTSYRDDQIVSILARSAAPFHLIHRENKFSFWICSVEDQTPVPHLIENDISYDQLNTRLNNYAADLRPQRIIDVKQGYDTFSLFRDAQPLQLALWASDVTGRLLVSHFSSTVNALRMRLDDRSDMRNLSTTEKNEKVTDLSIQLLGAIILADTGVFGERIRLHRPSLGELISVASDRFERYFKRKTFEKYFSEAEYAYQLLQQICYASFVPDMLKELYKAAYSKSDRQASGSYNTPLHFTRRIWRNIPIEFLAPAQRIVADMTCGWGSFLVAAHERLSALRDMDDSILRDHLHGNDSAYFTSRLAGLGLLLSTSEDSWKIQNYDALEWPWLRANQPHIIVGNPPFSGDRKKTLVSDSESEDKKRYEKANQYLEYAVSHLAPKGYLAMLMPSSFLSAEAAPDYRKTFLGSCDVLELWDVPSGIFDANVRTVVLFAQKKEERIGHTNFPVRTRTLQKYTIDNFSAPQIFTASNVLIDQSVWDERSRKSEGSKNTHIMDYKVILSEVAWQNIADYCINLDEVASIFRGVTKGRKLEKKRHRDDPNPQKISLLNNIRYTMPPNRVWWLDYSRTEFAIYPNDFKEPVIGKTALLAGEKVLVPYDIDPTWGKRVRVAIERRGCYASDHFYVVVPKPLESLEYVNHEVVAAVLNWDVSNAWIIEHLKSPAIPKRAINTVPFPKDLSKLDCELLTHAVHAIEVAAYANEPEPTEARELIDTILKRVYHLDDFAFSRLRQIKMWDSKPQVTLDQLPYNEKADCLISGVVDSVYAAQGTITLWLKGFDELQSVEIVSSMPGWMLRSDVAFRTEVPRKYIKSGIIPYDANEWGAFRPQPNTYMSEEELLERFANLSRQSSRRS